MIKKIKIPKFILIACCLLINVISINKLDASVSLNGSLGGYNFGSGHVFDVAPSASTYYDLNVVYNIIAGSEVNPLISQYNIDNAWNDTASKRAYLYYKLTICTTSVDVTSAGPNGLVIYQYMTNQSCPVDKYTGKLKYIYLNLKLTKHSATELEWWQHENSITFSNPSSTSYRKFNVKSFDLLSPSEFTEEVTNLTNNAEVINSLNKINDLNQTQIETNSKLNDLNNKQQQTNNKLDDLNNKQNQTNSKLDDLNNNLKNSDVDTNGSFFSNFASTDHGISGIITAPLRAINKLTSTCQPVTFSVLEEPIELPCGDTLFWNKEGVQSFRLIWNILVGGPILFLLLKKLFKVVESLKNPDDDRIEVMDL